MTLLQTHAYANINTARATTTASIAALNPQVFGFLTPETLLMYCQSKIRGIDEQVQRAFADQKSRSKIQQTLGELSSALDPNGFDGNDIGTSGKSKKDEVLAKYDAAIAAVGANSEMGQQLIASRAKFAADASGTKGKNDSAYVSAEDMKSYADPIGDMQATLNRDGELQMIQLQSLMSQRQTALQMCTNMISGLGQSSQQIAGNIGR
jgi:hypothetical protein